MMNESKIPDWAKRPAFPQTEFSQLIGAPGITIFQHFYLSTIAGLCSNSEIAEKALPETVASIAFDITIASLRKISL